MVLCAATFCLSGAVDAKTAPVIAVVTPVLKGAVHPLPPTPPHAPVPAFFSVSKTKSLQVVVDINTDPVGAGTEAALVFFLYAAKIQGHDMAINYYEFDCLTAKARQTQTGYDSKTVDPLSLKALDSAWYEPPKDSVIGQMQTMACKGHTAIPPGWTPLTGSLRDIAKAYYQGYLGQTY